MQVSCKYCGHWFTGTRERWRNSQAMAPCTFLPEWKNTGMDHFCGQFVGNSEKAPPAATNETWSDYQAAWQVRVGNQQRAIKAEKALKAARAEIRALKAAKPA